jgi:hypothetical protein
VTCELYGEGASRLPSSGYGIEYDWAIAVVQFRTTAFDFDGSMPMMTWQEETAAEMVTRPGSAYTFPSDSLALSQNVGTKVPIKDIVVTMHNVPQYDPTTTIFDNLIGTVNDATLFGKPLGTIMYAGLSTSGQRTVGGVTTWQLSHKIRYRKVPHNEIMRPDGTGFEAPEDDNGDPIYELADLSVLFG